MKKCKECDLEMDDTSRFDVCYNCRHDSGTKKPDDIKSDSDKNNKETPDQKTENNPPDDNPKNLSLDEQMLGQVKKQTKILLEQHKLQKRISNNVLFFFWITIISLFIVPLMWIIFGLSVLL